VGIEAKYQAVILAHSKGRKRETERAGGRAAVTIPISYYVSAQLRKKITAGGGTTVAEREGKSI
jgi:hypothetical protein